jgi:hypothetical protein
LLDYLLEFLVKEKMNEMMCVYFSNIVSNLLEHRGADLIERIIGEPKYMNGLLSKTSDYTMCQLIVKLLTYKAKEEE